ncbi:uncharacterized protein LOC119094364 [Pollicipes pollicipes]|uniref:uncharacterized protein LOC119094364 n=1 Tax=Pollicipes pollicipes TaxID=41117 RepID=UPI001885A391|nr:uncharacterized protein LOC119094364 [Pollicipes pollicipes]
MMQGFDFFSESVNITELRVPEVVEHNTNSTAILDCVYDLPDDGVNLLLVKWYFGDENHQVYQWGLGLEPAGSGVLKGRLHLGHVASPELLKKHRALSVSNPTVDLSGTYICRVMTNSGVVTEAKKMIVYAPARAMNLTQDKPSPSSVNITCVVEGVFPAPLLEVFAKREDKEDG